MRYTDQGGETMTQRQLNMIQAMEQGIQLAREELRGPGAERAIAAALEEFISDEPVSMSLGRTAYITALLIAWKDRGCPDLLT